MNDLMKEVEKIRYEASTDGVTTNELYLVNIVDLVIRWDKARGRYHTQIASADLMEFIGREGIYPDNYKKGG